MKKHEFIPKLSGNIFTINTTILLLFTVIILNGCGSAINENDKSDVTDENTLRLTGDTMQIKPQLANKADIHTQTPQNKKFIKTVDLKFKVNNALYVTERIEDLTANYHGYTIFSNLQNRNDNYKRLHVSRDSLLITTQITVVNNIQVRMPSENLDSFIRKTDPFVKFLDYRVIRLNDVTFDYLSNALNAERLKKYENRQTKNIDATDAKLKDKTTAEDILLEKQMQADKTYINTQKLEDDIQYSIVNIEIYQDPLIVKDMFPDFDYAASQKPILISRIADSLTIGWQVLEEIVVFLIKIWGIIVLIIIIIAGYRYAKKLLK